MQACFENLIGLRGACDSVPPTSGLYINDLGISLAELDEFCTADYANGLALFQAQYALALSIVSQNIHANFQQRYKAFSLLENKRVGYYNDSDTYIAGTNNHAGIRIEMYNSMSFVTLYLNAINLVCDTTGTKQVYVYETTHGQLLDTFSVDTIANTLSTTYVNKQYNFDSNNVGLFICWNSSVHKVKGANLNNIAYCNTCSSSKTYRNEFVEARMAKISAATAHTKNNFQEHTNTNGLSIVYSLNCNHNNWLCSISNLIALPVLYKTAALITEFGNVITPNEMLTNRSTLNRDLLKERTTAYETRYEIALANVLNNIELPNDERCFICRQQSRTAVMLP